MFLVAGVSYVFLKIGNATKNNSRLTIGPVSRVMWLTRLDEILHFRVQAR